ncbi:MAG: adenylate/guanylate cyclase domain-containing protein [Proteobacteria bacterium]|nr:adenylate/guanylate cyclase domain-containing protein [Pseudomonadota bacterium]
MSVPETKFTQSGEVTIAYQVVGNGSLDLVMVPGFISHLEQAWEDPSFSRFLLHLASFSRLILFDKRGTGLSDRIGDIPTLEERMDDVLAVMDAAESQQAALFGVSEGGPMSVLFAATYPDKVSALILYGSIAKGGRAPDYPWGDDIEDEGMKAWLEGWRTEWGSAYGIESRAPSMAEDEVFHKWFAKYMRLGGSPSAVINIFKMIQAIDVRDILPTVRVPTLVLHRVGDLVVDIDQGRYLAENIPGAKIVELPGEDHLWWVGDTEALVNEVQVFLTGEQSTIEIDRVLATVLFTDIVDSTKRAAEMGDSRWKDVLDTHNVVMLREIDRFRGRTVRSTGDGFLAVFDGPGRAIRCGSAVSRELRQLGIEIRVGVHTGEIDLMGEDIGGISVNIAARVLAEAANNEVWTSRTVKDLVVGSGFEFTEKGNYSLKGVPGEWGLFSVEA